MKGTLKKVFLLLGFVLLVLLILGAGGGFFIVEKQSEVAGDHPESQESKSSVYNIGTYSSPFIRIGDNVYFREQRLGFLDPNTLTVLFNKQSGFEPIYIVSDKNDIYILRFVPYSSTDLKSIWRLGIESGRSPVSIPYDLSLYNTSPVELEGAIAKLQLASLSSSKNPLEEILTFSILRERLRNGVSEYEYQNFEFVSTGIDAKTYEPVGDSKTFFRDRTNVYYYSRKVEGADPNTFTALSDVYGKDARAAFWTTKKIEGVDPETFAVFDQVSEVAQDSSYIYYKENRAPEIDRETFRLIPNLEWGTPKARFAADKDGHISLWTTSSSPERLQKTRWDKMVVDDEGRGYYLPDIPGDINLGPDLLFAMWEDADVLAKCESGSHHVRHIYVSGGRASLVTEVAMPGMSEDDSGFSTKAYTLSDDSIEVLGFVNIKPHPFMDETPLLTDGDKVWIGCFHELPVNLSSLGLIELEGRVVEYASRNGVATAPLYSRYVRGLGDMISFLSFHDENKNLKAPSEHFEVVRNTTLKYELLFTDDAVYINGREYGGIPFNPAEVRSYNPYFTSRSGVYMYDDDNVYYLKLEVSGNHLPLNAWVNTFPTENPAELVFDEANADYAMVGGQLLYRGVLVTDFSTESIYGVDPQASRVEWRDK